MKCDRPKDEQRIEVWLLYQYHHPNFKYFTLCGSVIMYKYLQWYCISFIEPCENFSIQYPMNTVIMRAEIYIK